MVDSGTELGRLPEVESKGSASSELNVNSGTPSHSLQKLLADRATSSPAPWNDPSISQAAETFCDSTDHIAGLSTKRSTSSADSHPVTPDFDATTSEAPDPREVVMMPDFIPEMSPLSQFALQLHQLLYVILVVSKDSDATGTKVLNFIREICSPWIQLCLDCLVRVYDKIPANHVLMQRAKIWNGSRMIDYLLMARYRISYEKDLPKPLLTIEERCAYVKWIASGGHRGRNRGNRTPRPFTIFEDPDEQHEQRDAVPDDPNVSETPEPALLSLATPCRQPIAGALAEKWSSNVDHYRVRKNKYKPKAKHILPEALLIDRRVDNIMDVIASPSQTPLPSTDRKLLWRPHVQEIWSNPRPFRYPPGGSPLRPKKEEAPCDYLLSASTPPPPPDSPTHTVQRSPWRPRLENLRNLPVRRMSGRGYVSSLAVDRDVRSRWYIAEPFV